MMKLSMMIRKKLLLTKRKAKEEAIEASVNQGDTAPFVTPAVGRYLGRKAKWK